jgi:hypothetical protein
MLIHGSRATYRTGSLDHQNLDSFSLDQVLHELTEAQTSGT